MLVILVNLFLVFQKFKDYLPCVQKIQAKGTQISFSIFNKVQQKLRQFNNRSNTQMFIWSILGVITLGYAF